MSLEKYEKYVVSGAGTTAKRIYNDTLHLAVQSAHQGCVLYAFSHSQDFISGNFAFGEMHCWLPNSNLANLVIYGVLINKNQHFVT